MKLQNRLMLIGLASLLAGGFVYSQIFIHNKNRKELIDIARELALNWKLKLNLSAEQALLLEDLIIEYTIKKNEIINADVPGVTKVKRLQKIQIGEHRKLRKLLDEEQFNEYVGIDKKLPDPIMDSISI